MDQNFRDSNEFFQKQGASLLQPLLLTVMNNLRDQFPVVVFFGRTQSTCKFSSQGLHPCHTCSRSHSSDNVGSLIPWATRELPVSSLSPNSCKM